MSVEKLYTILSAKKISGTGVDLLAGMVSANESVTAVRYQFISRVGMLEFLE